MPAPAPTVISADEKEKARAALAPGDEEYGLLLPQLNSGSEVTGSTKGRHRIENKQQRQQKLADQDEVNYWETHGDNFTIPPPQPMPMDY